MQGNFAESQKTPRSVQTQLPTYRPIVQVWTKMDCLRRRPWLERFHTQRLDFQPTGDLLHDYRGLLASFPDIIAVLKVTLITSLPVTSYG